MVGQVSVEPAESGAPSERRYKAFFSYNYADKSAGAKLFNKVDGYRPPKMLRGQATPLGPVPDKLYPCFRDREEEPTAHDIRAAVERALGASEHLIVLCSPAAARSEWVAWEIETFRKLHSEDRIHAVLLEGEPGESFPPALKSVATPLAADLRPEGDGWVDGSLKVIAGILGLSFGELKNREVARARAQTRNYAIAAGAFAFLFVGACATSWIALDRSEKLQSALIEVLDQVAERATRAYDQMGETMTTAEAAQELGFARTLTDTAFTLAPDAPNLLREQARLMTVYSRQYTAVGKAEEGEKAASQAMGIYERLRNMGAADFDTSVMHAAAMTERADALLTLGRSGEARSGHEAALAIRRDLAARDPNRPQLRNDLAISLQRLGDLAQRAGNNDLARSYFEECIAIDENLLALEPDNADHQNHWAFQAFRLAEVALAQGAAAEARKRFTDSLDIREKLVALHPENAQYKLDRWYSINGLADLDLQEGEVDPAKRAFEHGMEISRELIAIDPDNVEYQHTLSVSLDRLGLIARATGDNAGAKVIYTDMLKVDEQLIRIAPGDLEYQRNRAITLGNLGLVAMQEGDLTEAKARLDATLGVYAKLAALDPMRTVYQRDVSVAYEQLGDVAARMGDMAEAKARQEAALKAREAISAKEPTNVLYQRDISISLERLGDMARESNQLLEARPIYERMIAILEKLAGIDGENYDYQIALSMGYYRLALTTRDQALLGKAYAVAKGLSDKGDLRPDDTWMLAKFKE